MVEQQTGGGRDEEREQGSREERVRRSERRETEKQHGRQVRDRRSREMRRGLLVLAITSADKQFWPLSNLNNSSSFSLALSIFPSLPTSPFVCRLLIWTLTTWLFLSGLHDPPLALFFSLVIRSWKDTQGPFHRADNRSASVSTAPFMPVFVSQICFGLVWWRGLTN